MKGGINKACAACKYQRRRCSKECPLSPYFPADKPKMFSNAHRLFGVSNIMRILKQVEPEERDEAMKSIIYESDIRAKYPDHGCYGVIMQYQALLYKAMDELRYVQMLLAFYKEGYHHKQNLVLMDHHYPLLSTTGVSSFDDYVVYPDSGGGVEAKPNLSLYQGGLGTTNFNTIGSRSSEITYADANLNDAKSFFPKDVNTSGNYGGEGPSSSYNELGMYEYNDNDMSFKGKSSVESTSAELSYWENIESVRKNKNGRYFVTGVTK